MHSNSQNFQILANGDQDISLLWQNAHAHLKPNDNHGSSNIHYENCSLCGKHKSTELIANIKIADQWIEKAPLNYCFDCQGYFIKQRYLHQYNQQIPKPRGWIKKLLSSNHLHHVSDVNARLWSRQPTFLNLEPTTRCNFNCWYCIGRTMKQEDIDAAQFEKALDHFPSLETLALVGEGEPFMVKSFFNMVKLAIDRGIKVVTISNGSTLSQSIVKKLCESGITYISVSIDSTDPEIFAQSRLDGDLNKIWRGIGRLVKYRDEHGYQYPRVGLKGTLFNYSIDNMIDIIQEAQNHGVEILESFQPLNMKQSYIDMYPENYQHLLDQDNTIQQQINQNYQRIQQDPDIKMKTAYEFATEEGITFSNSGTANGIRSNCDEEWIYSLLSGDITPCCQIKEPYSKAWNIFSRPLMDIQQSTEYENMRFNLWNGFFLPECKGCFKCSQ